MSGSDESLRSYYAARAAEYDRIYRKPERQADLGQLRRWLPALFRRSRVLEVACGTGYWTRILAPVADEIVAVDAVPETMAIARRRVTGGRVHFVVGDAYRLPADDGRFSAAFAGFWFSHVPVERRREFLAGLNAVLEPGATVVLLDNRLVEGSSQPVHDHDRAGNAYQLRSLDDGSSYRVLKNFPGRDELRDAVGDGGRDLVYTQFDYYWVLRYAVNGGQPA